MAIKKRTSASAAEIEAFGDAADAPPKAMATTPVHTPETISDTGQQAPSVEGWPTGHPKTFLIRWPNADLVMELEAVAKLEDRSKHQTILRALERGLRVMRLENEH